MTTAKLNYHLNPRQIGVLIGPLRRERSADELAKCVFQLFNCIGIRCSDISRISINPHVGYAKVELYKKECEDYAMKILKEIRSIVSLYDLRNLTEKPKYLCVERIVPHEAESKELAGFSEIMVRKEHGSLQFRTLYNPLGDEGPSMLKHPADELRPGNSGEEGFEVISLVKTSSSCLSPVGFGQLTEDESQSSEIIKTHAATSTSGFPGSPEPDAAQPDETSMAKPIMVSAKTSTPTIDPCFYPGTNFYHRLQLLDWLETNYHFDPGNILTSDLRGFRIMIGKFICAFLNSGGGSIYYGVKKNGEVHGISLTQRYEDAIRLDIDSQIKLIKPDVPTSAYNINFAKVMDATGHIMPDLRVLEVKVRPPLQIEQKYSFKNISYIWKNKQVQEHKPQTR